uniref:Uncharacterized protein n=1 Tax=virus sp. ctkyY8 TaxID=2827995 RepID=A0A8S5REP1_9VIRU|nr:MAG TPA: hypothetical protein [virus sp. ctkyY8]
MESLTLKNNIWKRLQNSKRNTIKDKKKLQNSNPIMIKME